MLLAGSWTNGVGEIWVHPWRVLSDASLRIGGEPGTVLGSLRTPALAERQLRTPLGEAVERWTASAAHPACVWEVVADPEAPIQLECTADLTRADQAAARLEVTRHARGMRLSRAGGPSIELLLARGEAIEPIGGGGTSTRLRLRGRGTLRLVVVGGTHDGDLTRARERIERRGLSAITEERAQHARLVAEYGTAVESPAHGDVAAFEWAKVDSDGLLIVSPDGPRFAAAYHEPDSAEWKREGPVKWAGRESTLSLGTALLASGLRDPVREWLRASAAAGGRGAPAALAAVYHSWTGESAAAAQPVTHSTPHPRLAHEPGTVWAPLLRELMSRWGAVATGGASLALEPAMPDDWREMAIRRLRVGASVVDAELRRRFDRIVVRVSRRHGPPLPVELELPGAPPIAITADDQPLPVGRVVLSVADRHEVIFQR